MKDAIDVVILWVDGGDREWQKLKAEWSGSCREEQDDAECRYRSWDNLRYWFRGIEKFMPWVRKVHLVTNGQCPDWLDLDNPKLSLVSHSDYMPEDCLPTFNSAAIEVGLHNIPDLQEHFIYFNDDMFVVAPCEPSDFFVDGLPCDCPVQNTNFIRKFDDGWRLSLTGAVNMGVLNRHFSKKAVVKRWHHKWFGTFLGVRGIFEYLIRKHHPFFDGLLTFHNAQPFLKSTFAKVWNAEPEVLSATQHNRFRSELDMNPWLLRNWQLAEGNFIPKSMKDRFFVNVDENNAGKVASAIRNQKYRLMCINDSDSLTQEGFLHVRDCVNRALDDILPDRCSFEK